MPWRLWRRIKIAPGVTINVSKSGLSTSIGPRGAKVTLGRHRIRRTVGLPGTGLYFTSSTKRSEGPTQTPGPVLPGAGLATPVPAGKRSRLGCLGWGAAAIVALGVIGSVTGGGKPSPTATSSSPGAHGIGGVAAGSQPASGSVPSEEPSPAPTSAGTEPSAGPQPTIKPPVLVIKIANAPGRVSRNAYASLTAKTKAGARCSIDVEYASGSSTASGLGDKTVGASGLVTWKWRVGSNTSKGSWPIYVFCSRKGVDGQATSSIKVT